MAIKLNCDECGRNVKNDTRAVVHTENAAGTSADWSVECGRCIDRYLADGRENGCEHLFCYWLSASELYNEHGRLRWSEHLSKKGWAGRSFDRFLTSVGA